VIDRHQASFSEADSSFQQVQTLMRRQNYTNWKTIVDESIVRAATILRVLATKGSTERRALVVEQQNLGFYWISDLVDTLATWERTKEARSTIADLAPRLAQWFNRLGERLPAMRKAFDAQRPKIIAMFPRNNDTLVDPTLTTMTFQFDQPMNRGWSMFFAPDDPKRERFPGFGLGAYDTTATTLIMNVTLVPGKEYAFTLNSVTGGGFRSRENFPLEETVVRFRTRN